jgi:DNA uptake protein ComE-like DNA-binding protein
MKLNLNLTNSAIKSIFSLSILLMVACSSSPNKEEKANSKVAEASSDEYFSVKIDGKLWQAFPSKEFKTYNLSYKELGHQFSIFAEAEDGSRMDLSFHSHNQLVVGSYPSTRNDNGMLSGVFYYPEAKSSDKETASTTMDHPVQENTVQVTKIDKSNKAAYVIEGRFSPTMYAVYETNPIQTSKLTEGKFRVIYRPDSMNPAF